MQTDLFVGEFERPPVMVAWDGGVDSTAMIIEMVARGEPIDIVLFADTFSERPWTYKAIEIFAEWLAERGIRFERVFYQARKFKNYPSYLSLLEDCLTNGTLPSIAFGFGSCSLKNKVQPQNAFTKMWEPAVNAGRQGMKVIKSIGYDCSPVDKKRYAEREGYVDDAYEYRYPLRECCRPRKECEERILQEGLPVVKKSACSFCTATKSEELLEYEPELLRTIVLMEARASPCLKTTEDLWRKAAKAAPPAHSAITGKGFLDAAATVLSFGMNKLIKAAGLSPRFLIIALLLNEYIGLMRVISMGEGIYNIAGA